MFSFSFSRPATSFAWFSSPFKSLRYILWRRYKWLIIKLLIVALLIALAVLFFYSMPVSNRNDTGRARGPPIDWVLLLCKVLCTFLKKHRNKIGHFRVSSSRPKACVSKRGLVRSYWYGINCYSPANKTNFPKKVLRLALFWNCEFLKPWKKVYFQSSCKKNCLV